MEEEMFKTTLTAAALSVAILASPVTAAEGSVPNTTIEFKDLNLTTSEGQEALDRRIDKAARAICQVDDTKTGTRVRSRDRVACVKAAKKSVKKQVAALIERDGLGG